MNAYRKVGTGVLSLLLVACGESATPSPSSSDGGSSGAGSGGAAGTAGGGGQYAGGSSSGGSGGQVAGSGGTVASGGSGGTVASGGSAGASGGNAGSGGSAGSDGVGGSTGGSGGSAGSGGGPPACQNGKVVHFVYFVEADATYSESQRADVERQAFAFQQFWYDQLGVTFYLNYPVVDVIEADHEAEWYLTTPDGIHNDSRWYRLGNIKNEVYQKLGIQNFDPNHRVVNYPTSRHDGRVGANFGGAWMDGDDLTCIADGGFNYPYDDGNSAHCIGHVAHEFGHVLGLDHEGPNDDCMMYGFYTDDPNDPCSFSSANVAKILANPANEGWFEAMPGETCTGP